MSDNELAEFLTRVAAMYYDRRSNRLAPDLMDERVKELDSMHVLSLKAISAIVGCDEGHVIRVVGGDAGRPRGKLNPAHISWLGYILSTRSASPGLIAELIRNGTSLSTIASLTNVSQATLYRWRKQ